MRFTKKHPFLTALAVFAIAVVGVCWFYLQDDHLDRQEIGRVVENYGAQLQAVAENGGTGTLPEGVQTARAVDGVTDFYCGGAGTGHYGFYYSPEGQPKAVFCGRRFAQTERLEPAGGGWAVENEESRYYTEAITERFFYYEAHFE